MISSLISLAFFVLCCLAGTSNSSKRSGSRIMTPNGESTNYIPQPQPSSVPFTTLINESMMLTQSTLNPPVMTVAPPVSTGTVPPADIASVPPIQVVYPPIVFTVNESFMLNGTSSASNPPMAPGSPSFSPPITTEVPIYIDLSDPNRVDVDFGMTTSSSSPLTTVSTTTSTPATIPTPVPKRKFEEKCLEYYNIGKRTTRKTKVQVFIIGGENSREKEFPHMAALGYGKQNQQQWLCGGSLISENYVLTAAHCLTAKSLGDIQYVRLGTTTLQTETLNSEDFNVIRRIPHPGYVQGKQYNDIALLQLDRPVDFSDYIAPICLSDFKDFVNTKLIATGWGKVEADGIGSPELQKVELEYYPNDVCQVAYDSISLEDLPNGISEETQICAGAFDGSRDTCQGDSGGPLQLQQDGRLYLVGITSFGIGCGRADSPGVYTRVSYYIPWIESIVW
nr:serine protease snake-like isoform X2 [Leptinotarsa decemlineata]